MLLKAVPLPHTPPFESFTTTPLFNSTFVRCFHEILLTGSIVALVKEKGISLLLSMILRCGTENHHCLPPGTGREDRSRRDAAVFT